ncbi:unnamed protein product [Somion occarium]|uniref:Up-regulated during septation protein 1 domain-containing protein n=1 Tax=Somion occarium TaxID=3059160 RepID=A0ABP1CZS1_9APHY
MNGVRRFLGGGGSGTTTPTTQGTPLPATPPTTAPLFISKPSWPPNSPPQSPPGTSPPQLTSPKTTTAALFFRRDKQRPIPTSEDENGIANSSSIQSPRSSNGILSTPSTPSRSTNGLPQASSPGAGPSSPSRLPLPQRVSQLSRKSVDRVAPASLDLKRISGTSNIRDELLISLLASEAVVDSRGYEALSSEEVEELKKEYQVLSSRLVALNKKLQLETKMRDAALSLSKANASYKNVSKQSADQLDAANRKVETAQKELWKVSERANEIQQKKIAPPDTASGDTSTNSGYSTPNRSSQISPTATSMTSLQSASSKARFEHFFAGHSDAVTPSTPRRPPTTAEVQELEEKLKAATSALEAANAKQAKMSRELSLLRLDKEQIETTLSMELQNAEDTINALEKETDRWEEVDVQYRKLQEEKDVWEQEHVELESRRQEVGELQQRVQLLEQRSGEASDIEQLIVKERETHKVEIESKSRELDQAKQAWEADRAAWELEKSTLESQIQESAAKLQEALVAGEHKAKLDECFDALRDLVQVHGILLVTREPTLTGLVASVGHHLENFSIKLTANTRAQEEWAAVRTKLEEDVRVGLDKREALFEELDKARRERDEVKSEVRDLQGQLQEQSFASVASSVSLSGPVEYTGDAEKVVAVLKPLWAILPSPEARAGKMGSRFRAGSPGSPTSSPVTPRPGPSLSEMDVRSLKTLYDPKGLPFQAGNKPESFTVEAFADRVQALIADDRALIERLVRFAQAHDLLKKNAERAQKLAQESNIALETYQKQVKLLEERGLSMMTKQAELQDEVHDLQETIDLITAEKLEMETHAAEQAETCRQLTDANNSLSARALTLASEAASASDGARKRLEAELAECNAALKKARAEIDSMRESQQVQQMALMEELNSVQTENDSLRTQLRAKK